MISTVISLATLFLPASLEGGDLFVVVAQPGHVLLVRDGDLSSDSPFAWGLESPYGLVADSSGRLLVGERGSGEITDIQAGGDFQGAKAFATGLIDPRDLLLTQEGRLLVAELSTGRVLDVTDGGASHDVFAWGLTNPRGLHQTRDGRLLVVEEGSGEVTDITEGGDVTFAPPFLWGMSLPYALTSNRQGDLYACQLVAGTVTEVTDGGDISSKPPFAWGLGLVDEILVDARGRLLAVQELQSSIMDITAGGDFVGVPPTTWGLNDFPQQLAFLPLCALSFETYGDGTPGTGGVIPSMWGLGTDCDHARLGLQAARGEASALVLLSAAEACLPLADGKLLVDPVGMVSMPIQCDGDSGDPGGGRWEMILDLEEPLEATIYLQAVVFDEEAVSSIALSDGLRMTLEPR